MIDLSFLTDEEQEAIMKVLQRDAALKRAEEERVRHLPEKIKDDQQLKNMSGQWFYEAKAKRHRDKIHGADIIRASMRKKRLQVAAEQSKDRAIGAKESWVNNVNKDAFLPPELAGVVEEPEEDAAPRSPSPNVMDPVSAGNDVSPENSRKSTMSSAKQRKNPFISSELPEDHLSQPTENEQSKNGRAALFQISKEGEQSESKEKSSIPNISSRKSEKSKQTVPKGPEDGSQVKAPIPKARKLLYKSNDLKKDGSHSFLRQRSDSLNARGLPRGILKRNSSSSSTDSETLRSNHSFEPKGKIVSPSLTIQERISEKEHSLEDDSSPNSLEPLKHVRFSAVKDELPQSPGLIHGQEVGEFSVLESDRMNNKMESAGNFNEFQDDPKPSQYGKVLPFPQPASSSGTSKNETQQLRTSSSVPNNELDPHSEVLITGPQSLENLPAIDEHQAESSELTELESEFLQNPADDLSHCIEPEPSQVPDGSSRDHQQGKPPLLDALKAKTSSCSGLYATEISKTTDDSISKVLDWFNRSSHSDDSKSSLQHPQEIEPQGKTDSGAQALLTDDINLKEHGSKTLSPTKVKLKPVRSDSTFQVEEDTLISENCPDSVVNIKLKPMNVSHQGSPEDGPGILQPFSSSGTSSQGSKNMEHGQGSNSIEGNGVPLPSSVPKGSGAEVQASCNTKTIGSLDREEPMLHVLKKYSRNSKGNFNSSTIVQESHLKNNVEAERKRKEGNTSILKASSEIENIEFLPGATNSDSPQNKPEVQLQQEAVGVPNNQVQREKYRRVSDRISFWEGEKDASKVTIKEPSSPCSQGQSSAKAYQPAKSQRVSMDDLSVGQSNYDVVTAKRVILDDDDSSNKPKDSRPQISGPSKHCSSADQPDKASPVQNKTNEQVRRLPVEDNLHSRRDITLPAQQHPSDTANDIYTPSKDRVLIGESNTNFKVMSLKERMDEPNSGQVYNHSQFENLRKFWDLGANPNNKNNYEKNTTNPLNSVPLNSQKNKEFIVIKSSGKNTHEAEVLWGQKNIMSREEMEKSNPKHALQVLPDETTFPSRPPRQSIHQFAGNELPKENVGKNTEWSVTPVLKKEKPYADLEIQESVMKTHVLSKDYQDTLNNCLQKLLSEASLQAVQPSGRRKAHEEQVLETGDPESRKLSQKADLVDKEEAKGPKEVTDERVHKAVAPPKVRENTLAASLNKLPKEANGTLHSPSQSKLEPVATRHSSQPEDGSFLETGIKQNHSVSAHKEEMIDSLPEESETWRNTTFTLKAASGECQLATDNLLQKAAEGSFSPDRPSHLHRKGSFEDVANSPKDMPFSWDVQLAPPDRALPSQREISEIVEKVVLPPKPVLEDINAVLKRLRREAWLTCPSGREVGPREVKSEFLEGAQTAGIPLDLGVAAPEVTVDTLVPDRKGVYSLVPDKAPKVGSYLAVQMSPSEELLSSSVSPSQYEKNTGTLSTSDFIGSTAAPRQAALEFHPEEIEETVEKVEALPITESAFDAGFEKLLKEMFEAPPPFQLQVSLKKGTPEKEPSQSEQARFLETMPHFDGATSGASELKDKSNGLQSQVNQCTEVLGGDEAMSDLSVALCGSSSGAEIPGTPQLNVDHEIQTRSTVRSPEDRDGDSDIAGELGAFQKPGFEEAPKVTSVSRNGQPVLLLTNKDNSSKISKVELMLASTYKRQDKEHEKEGFSDSKFSDGNMGSTAESWRNISSSEEEPSPVLKPLEMNATRKVPSKSLEDISSDSSNQAKVDNLPEELVRSAEDDQKADQEPDTNENIPGISTVPLQPDNQFSHPDKLKRMSKSVPAFLQDESDDRETDTASESSYQLSRHKKSASSLTNLSSSSGMTSLSSVSGSVMSVYSGDFGNLEVKGNIQFAIEYVDSLKELHVFVAQCKDLAAADAKKQRSDPYVKTYLLPDKGKMGKKKTLVVKKTLNPVYNEILRYKVEKEILKTQKLNLSVWHRDTFKRNSFLGEVELDLEAWDWDNKQNKQLRWYPLKRKTAPVALEVENRGEMKLALQYVPEPLPGKKLPTTGEVHIWVKECLELPLLRGSHLNSFVKCTILPDTSRKSRQKTRAVGKTNNPIFNHTMVYDGFRPEDLTEACVELTVWDHYKLTNQFLGGLRIGFGTGKSYGTEVDWMDSTSEEVALWEKMVNSPNTWIEATLPLRMLLIAKISK